MRTIPGEKPEEQCSLEPQRQRKHVTKLLPPLKPQESCTDVPKEVFTRSQTNPRKVQKPVLKKWQQQGGARRRPAAVLGYLFEQHQEQRVSAGVRGS